MTVSTPEPVFMGKWFVRGETQLRWRLGDVEITGGHTRGSWWSVYVMRRTPDGKHFCGMSHQLVNIVRGGRGRDERILKLGVDFLEAHPNFHDQSACGVCRPAISTP